ncbi:MAG: GNAT family N-acetyltransferase [Actinobacteria bacterium]|nr:GNAT family N-acetyltransferase [Actinomycetota bacterium]
MSTFLIRDLEPADLSAATRINNDNVPAVSEADEDKMAHLLAESSIALAAVEPEDETLLGFCIVMEPGADYGSSNYRWFCERYDDFIYLDRVAVDEGARGAGIGAALYREVQDRTGKALFTLEVNLRPRNDGSLRFHAREGFTEVGQMETDYGVLVSMHAKQLR